MKTSPEFIASRLHATSVTAMLPARPLTRSSRVGRTSASTFLKPVATPPFKYWMAPPLKYSRNLALSWFSTSRCCTASPFR